MWTRRTFHECASELGSISIEFRAAHRTGQLQIMIDTSERGVEVLRILALSIRSDEDYGHTQIGTTQVGILRSRVTALEVRDTIRDYRPPYKALAGYAPLTLRLALNKIAHADPAQSGFFADEQTHDLILSGTDKGSTWLAIISVIDLCNVVQSLPDRRNQT